MIRVVGGAIFHEHYVSFHLHRENFYCPWRVIGVYDSYGKVAKCRYVDEYDYIEEQYQKEVELAGDLCGTYDFLNNWRLKQIDLNSCMTKVVKFNTTQKEVSVIIHELASTYVGGDYPHKLAKIAVMVKSREKYFPIVFHCVDKESKRLVLELKKAGLA